MTQEEHPPITDLRSALQRLADHPGQLIETDHPVDPNGELAGVYRHIGAGGTVMRPTRIGPAMMFNSVIGFPDVRVLVGLTASRERVGILFDSPPNRLTQRMAEAYRDAIAPVKFSGDKAPCQQVVHRADEPGFDLRTILPALTNTDRDAGRFSAWDWCSAAIPNWAPTSPSTACASRDAMRCRSFSRRAGISTLSGYVPRRPDGRSTSRSTWA